MDLALRLHKLGTLAIIVTAAFFVLMFASPAAGGGGLWSGMALFAVFLSIPAIGIALWGASLTLMAWRGGSLSKRRLLVVFLVVLVPLLLFVWEEFIYVSTSRTVNTWGVLLCLAAWVASIFVAKRTWDSHRERMLAVTGLGILGALGAWSHAGEYFFQNWEPLALVAILIGSLPLVILFYFYPAWLNADLSPAVTPSGPGEEDEKGEETPVPDADA